MPVSVNVCVAEMMDHGATRLFHAMWLTIPAAEQPAQFWGHDDKNWARFVQTSVEKAQMEPMFAEEVQAGFDFARGFPLAKFFNDFRDRSGLIQKDELDKMELAVQRAKIEVWF
jgi:hypothetical protein